MASPFPGMDPYLEDPDIWSGVHASILAAIFEQLGTLLRPKYAVRFEARRLEALDGEPRRHRRLIDLGDQSVVTVIELLHPTDKDAGGRGELERRRREALAGGANWVEIDLLRAGERASIRDVVPVTEYRVTAFCSESRGGTFAWPIRLQERLPVVGVPLRDDDDVPLDLQAAVDAAVRRGSYDLDADYSADPVPPLTGAAAEWARTLLSRGE